MPESVWAAYQVKNYPYKFSVAVETTTAICGGTPSNPRVAESFLKTKLGDKDEQLRAAVAELMVERGIDQAEAAKILVDETRLNGFRREDGSKNPDRKGQLWIGGYQMKACLKEAVNVAANAGRITTKGWGDPDNANYKKGIKSWFPEHVFVVEDRLYLDGVTEPTGIAQRFVRTPRGVSGIQYEEFVEGATINFTVETDFEFKDAHWAAIWTTAEHMGVGATRSMGYGQFKVTRWEPLS